MVLSVALTGCWNANAARAVRLDIVVTDDQGVPLPDAPIEIEGVVSARSGHQGHVSVTLEANAPRARFSAVCPQGYRAPEPRSVPLSPRGRQPLLELRFVCRPQLRSLLVVVRAPQAAGMVVRADGESIGSVGAEGTLHAVLEREPGSDVRLMLDTSAAPRLLPQNPIREIKVADSDELVVFDQALSEAPVPRKTKPREPGSLPSKHIPYAIGSDG
jgi:hypothetical protein